MSNIHITKLKNIGVIFESVSKSHKDLITYIEEKINKKIQYADVVEFKNIEVPSHFKELHSHTDIEARYFLEGSGSFCIRYHGTIYKLDCVKDDLLIIPSKIEHYFVPSKENYFKVLRLFTDTNGWNADFVSNDDTNS